MVALVPSLNFAPEVPAAIPLPINSIFERVGLENGVAALFDELLSHSRPLSPSVAL